MAVFSGEAVTFPRIQDKWKGDYVFTDQVGAIQSIHTVQT